MYKYELSKPCLKWEWIFANWVRLLALLLGSMSVNCFTTETCFADSYETAVNSIDMSLE